MEDVEVGGLRHVHLVRLRGRHLGDVDARAQVELSPTLPAGVGIDSAKLMRCCRKVEEMTPYGVGQGLVLCRRPIWRALRDRRRARAHQRVEEARAHVGDVVVGAHYASVGIFQCRQ